MSHGGRHDPVDIVNDHHADDLLAVARAFGGRPDATAARAERIDREGMDLVVDTPRGPVGTHVAFAEPVADGDPAGLRIAFANLVRRANAALAAGSTEPGAP